MLRSRPVKILVGALSLWPFLYMLLFFAFVISMIFWTESARSTAEHHAGLPVGIGLLFVAHIGTMILMFALTAFYIVYVFKTDGVPQDKKALWAVAIFLGNMIAMPVFFYLYVWPDQWPRPVRPRPATTPQGTGA